MPGRRHQGSGVQALQNRHTSGALAGLSERDVANAVQITANGGTVDAGAGFFRFTGNITDAPGSSGGAFVLESTVTGLEREVILAGNNTYSGATSIASGP